MMLALLAPAAALAHPQTASGRPARPPSHEPSWEIAVHAGGFLAGVPLQGLPSPTAPAPFFTAVNGTFSRHTPSWFFGEGGLLFNEAASGGVAGDHIVAIDDVVAGPSGNPGKGWSAGARVTRLLNPRVSIEGTIEYSRSRLQLRKSAVDNIEAARASFASAWTMLLATDSATFQNPVVMAMSTIDPGTGHQVVANGAIVFNILTHRRNTPYTSVAVGVMSNGGRPPSVRLSGHYTTTLNGTAPIDETDSVALRYAVDRTLVAVTVGLGLKHMVTDRWGVRVEMREQLCSNPVTNFVSASPTLVLTTTSAQQGAAATARVVSVQLANIPTSTIQSSLGGSLPEQKLFTGTGMESRLTFTGGLFWRF